MFSNLPTTNLLHSSRPSLPLLQLYMDEYLVPTNESAKVFRDNDAIQWVENEYTLRIVFIVCG
jgi:hypothetical protein